MEHESGANKDNDSWPVGTYYEYVYNDNEVKWQFKCQSGYDIVDTAHVSMTTTITKLAQAGID